MTAHLMREETTHGLGQDRAGRKDEDKDAAAVFESVRAGGDGRAVRM